MKEYACQAILRLVYTLAIITKLMLFEAQKIFLMLKKPILKTIFAIV
jgi:hypothetical protein